MSDLGTLPTMGLTWDHKAITHAHEAVHGQAISFSRAENPNYSPWTHLNASFVGRCIPILNLKKKTSLCFSVLHVWAIEAILAKLIFIDKIKRKKAILFGILS